MSWAGRSPETPHIQTSYIAGYPHFQCSTKSKAHGIGYQRHYQIYPSTQHTSDSSFMTNEDAAPKEPPQLSAWRQSIRELAAEFIGTMILVIIGTGVNCQTTLSTAQSVSSSPKGDYTSVPLAWGAGLALGVWVSGGISGGHINPVVTLVQAIFRGFPWRKVPGYILAQILGACAGAALVYADYHRAIDLYEGGVGVRTVPGTAALFATFAPEYQSNALCFYEEVLGTFLLVLVILAMTDKQNSRTTTFSLPLALFLLLVAVGGSLGMQTGFALNPARDLGPRLLCWFVGYGRKVWDYRSQYWLYAPVIGPMVGGILGALTYDLLLYTEDDNIIYKILSKAQPEKGGSRDRLNLAENGESGNRAF